MVVAIIHFTFIMTICLYLILIVSNGTGINEFEFVFVEKGNAIFWAGEKQFSITEGQGFWVNSGILHRFYSEKGAVIPNFLLLPTFIAASNSRIYQKVH